MTDNLPTTRQPMSMTIKTLRPQLPERGRIKLGMKGAVKKSQGGKDYQAPEKLSYMLVTTLERGPDNNFKRDEEAVKLFGEKPVKLPVRLLYDAPELNMPSRLAAYKGKTLWCTGDGEQATRLTDDGKERKPRSCPCELSDPAYSGSGPKCKINASLSVIIRGLGGVGGVWKLRTTSWNTLTSVLSSMEYIRTITGGPLAGLPLELSLVAKSATNPVDGSPVTIYVANLMFEGADEDALAEAGHRVALSRAQSRIRIELIEDEARRVLALPPPANSPLHGDDDDVVDEFYPEQVNSDGVVQDAKPSAASAIAALTAGAKPTPEPELVQFNDMEIPLGKFTPEEWTSAMILRLNKCESLDEMNAVLTANDKTTTRLESGHADQKMRINDEVSRLMDSFDTNKGLF